mmetsp:Transcript_45749/g.115663  ORF Transcript_45749/g.115663 Transcript_45749/m.115663 type:complete len:328 (+) Transcript_45749:896-1879(+)
MGRGNERLGQPRKLWLKRARLAASRVRSSCSFSGAPNWRMLSSTRSAARRGTALHAAASRSISSKSRAIRPSTPGWRTLIATTEPRGRPVRAAPPADSVARCTCAMEPLATGASSKLSNSSASGAPKAPSTAATEKAALCAGACVCSVSSVAHMSGGNMSGRVAAHWPHLMNAGPARCSVPPSSPIHRSRPQPSHMHGAASSARGVNSARRYSARPAVASSPASRAASPCGAPESPPPAAPAARASSRLPEGPPMGVAGVAWGAPGAGRVEAASSSGTLSASRRRPAEGETSRSAASAEARRVCSAPLGKVTAPRGAGPGDRRCSSA